MRSVGVPDQRQTAADQWRRRSVSVKSCRGRSAAHWPGPFAAQGLQGGHQICIYIHHLVNAYRCFMSDDLTPRQREILKLIQDTLIESGMPPTRAEIAAALGFKSPNAAEEHLRALQRKGVLDLIPGASRGIQLKDSLREQMGLPLIGRVAAGRPMLAEEHIEGRYQIDPKIFQPARTIC